MERKEELMSYIALYRKWRPKTFTEVVGAKASVSYIDARH